MSNMVKEEVIDENQNISEVSIYKRDEVFLKIEPGTSLKLLKLLCESEGIKIGKILGVKSKHASNVISRISTSDETRLFESEYQLVLNENGMEPERDCTECAKLKSKIFVNVGVNTEDLRGNNSPSNSRKRSSPPIFTSQPPSNDSFRRKAFSPPQFVFPATSRESQHSYKALQEATKKLYSRQPGIGSISMDYIHSSSSPYEKPTSRDSFSSHGTQVRNIESVIKSVPAFKSSAFKHADSRQAFTNGVLDGKYNISKEVKSEIKTHAQDSPPALLRFHDNLDRESTFEMTQMKGEEPPVFVLPNDFDATSAAGDVYSKREHHLNISTPYMELPYSPNNRSPNQSEKSPYYVSPKQNGGVEYFNTEVQNINSPNKKSSPKRNYSPDSSTGSEGKLRCKICGRTFTTKSLLYKHLRGHTSDEKPFKCSECGQGFTLSSNLRQHRIIHRGYKPFQCEFCGKKFMRSNVYKQHRRIHTGEEMHKCTLCPSEFLQKYALVKHMKKNHNVESSDI